MGELRKHLIDAKLSGERTDTGYTFRSNEDAADRAIAEFAVWLFAEAAELRREDAAMFDISRQFQAQALEDRARALTHPDTTERL